MIVQVIVAVCLQYPSILSYRDMVIDAITTQKERAGSSLIAIKNHLGSKYKVDVAQKPGALNRFHYLINCVLMFAMQGAEEDARRRDTCCWRTAWQEGGRLFQDFTRGEEPHCCCLEGCC